MLQFNETPEVKRSAELRNILPNTPQVPQNHDNDQLLISHSLDPEPDPSLSASTYITRSGRLVRASNKYSGREWIK